MGFIAVPLGYLLTFIYKLVGNYGISLIILTVLVKLLLYPLYFKQIKSTASMSSLQPKMKAIQEKYKNDKEKMNEELQKPEVAAVIEDLGQPDLWILPIAAAVSTYISFAMTQQLTGQNEMMGGQGKSMNMIMKYFFPLSILWLARAYPAGLAIYWAGGQFIQIFLNIRMNKFRAKLKEEQELEEKRRRAEKQLEKMKKARMKG